MLKLIEDAEIDMPDEDCLLLPWLSAARDGLDILACFALDGLLLLESIGCFPHCPPQLPKIISLLLRDKQKTHPHFPKASAAASAVDSILEHAPLQDTESEDAGEGQAMFAEHHRQASVVSPDGASTISRASSAGDPGPFSGADAAIMADAFRKALRKPEFEGRPVDEGESLKTDNPDATAGELAEEGRDIRNPSGSSALGRDADAKAGDPGPFSGADAAIMADAFRKALRKPDFAGRPV
ncbi:hypothetical protein B0H17DRAFT_323020 [Mycena rosella]|uniref:Uncharacterized protein n=1 Tax=Mycena rosella TaxID=1033263 RepID=A0AAD7CT33_MYCRO|nr:hypothetical protein B0H17DRAFT_323020 [Mycena rosella]